MVLEWNTSSRRKVNGDAIFIPALNKENFDELRKLVYDKVREIHTERFPYDDFLYEDYTGEEE